MLNLGTKKHKDKYYDGIDSLEYPGCFAMTELHHGRLLLRIFTFNLLPYFSSVLFSLFLSFKSG